jgi:hypothetical protein
MDAHKDAITIAAPRRLRSHATLSGTLLFCRVDAHLRRRHIRTTPLSGIR